MVIFCDLDGVIVDSRKECLEILKIIFPNINNNKNYQSSFYINRGLVDPPEDFLILHKLISNLNSNRIISKKKFENFKDNTSEKKLINFKKIFFKTRSNLIKINFIKWIKLNQITTFGKKIRSIHNLNIIILTTKNYKASKSICEYYKINYKRILANEDLNKKTKGDLIKIYLDNNNIKNAIFIDDSSKHLKTCKDKRVLRLFANWGYNKTSIYKKFKLIYFEKLIKTKK